MNWPAMPFVRLLLPLCIGILTGFLLPSFLLIKVVITSGFLLFCLLIFFRGKQLSYRKRRWFGGISFALLTCLGFLLTHLHLIQNHPQFIGRQTSRALYSEMTVREIRHKESSIRLTAEVSLIKDSVHSNNTLGRVLLYLKPTDSTAHHLEPGDQLLVKAGLPPIEGPKNPKAFDFAHYMAGKGIFHQAFLDPEDWIRIGHRTMPVEDLFTRLRRYCRQVLTTHLPGEQELAIGAALITGQRSMMEEEVKQAYTATGAVHVLAVSGLHIGMIYFGLKWLLGLLGWRDHARRFHRSFILLAAVWGFALFTGGSASVLRAATMFSFIILGEALYRQQNIYNSLAASAFLLLCINPLLLRDVGFQLSYLAVVGIVFFQNRIYRTFYIHNRLGDYLWKLTSVSIAAQLTTLPISLFYFHQFPLYFWLSGWLVVPGAMLILALGLSLLFLAKIPLVGAGLGWLLYQLIHFMNRGIFAISDLPGGLLQGFWLSLGTTLILYTALLCLMAGLARKQLKTVRVGLCCLLLVAGQGNWHLQKSIQQKTICIYHVRGHTAIDLFDGQTAWCFSDLPADAPAIAYSAENFREYSRIREVRFNDLSDPLVQLPHLYAHEQFIRFGNKSILIVDDGAHSKPVASHKVDYLLIRDTPELNFEQMDYYYDFQTIIFDASNRRQKVAQWMEVCTAKGWDCYDVESRGAFTVQLE
jgi:competence protein ComEC